MASERALPYPQHFDLKSGHLLPPLKHQVIVVLNELSSWGESLRKRNRIYVVASQILVLRCFVPDHTGHHHL